MIHCRLQVAHLLRLKIEPTERCILSTGIYVPWLTQLFMTV